jgi:hypothetical protein
LRWPKPDWPLGPAGNTKANKPQMRASLQTQHMPPIEAIAVINNEISADLTRRLIDIDGIPFSRVGLILIRDVRASWVDQCGSVVRYGGRPVHSMLGQHRFQRFFRDGAALIKKSWAAGGLREIYVVNNDNLLTSPLFIWAERQTGPRPRLSVVAEGIMNYQEIGIPNRASWRWRAKPFIARVLGLPYRVPTSHLSGAFEPAVQRVVSFTKKGLKAPPAKVTVLSLEAAPISRPTDSGTCLILHTGLWQWMAPGPYEAFGKEFASWIRSQGFTRIISKPHPRIATGKLQDWLPMHEVLKDVRSAEDMAHEIPAATVVGTCCTALATLKLMRPDIRCVDFGADFYCKYAYGGDDGVIEFLQGAGVEVLPSGLTSEMSC